MALTDVTDGSRIIQQGIAPVKITLAEACKAGDLLGYSSGWKKADADNSIYAELVAATGGASGDEITAYRAARVSGLTGMTAGGAVYLSDTAGGYSESAGTVGQVVGISLSASEMMISPQYSSGGQLIPGAIKLFFRDSGLFINSSADGKLTISSDGAGTDDITLSGKVTHDDDVTMADAKNIVVNATTGTKIGTATTQKLGFYNATPAVQPSAYTQTYATANKTHANPTGVDVAGLIPAGGTGATAGAYDSAANRDTMLTTVAEMKTTINALVADMADIKQLANSIIDDLQALGLAS